MRRREHKILLALVLAAALSAGCGGTASQGSGTQETSQTGTQAEEENSGAEEQVPAETASGAEAQASEEGASGAEAQVPDAAQAKESGDGTQEELPPYTVVIPEEKTEIAQPVPEYVFYGDYSAEHYLITAEENPDVLSTIENLTYMDIAVKRLTKSVASVPVAAKFHPANELNQLTVWLKQQKDWDELYAALQKEDPDTADEYMENIRELCTIGIADFTFAEESGRTYMYNRYVYTLEGETMTCTPIEGLTDDYQIEYKKNAQPLTFHVEFRGDILRMENGDCAVALLPYQKWEWCTNSANPYVIIAAVEKPEYAYENIVAFNGSWSNAFEEKASFMQLTFADGSMTDFATTEAVRTEPNTLTVSWTNKYDETGKEFEDPGSITIRYLNGGSVLAPLFVAVDDEGNLYPYLLSPAYYSDNNP